MINRMMTNHIQEAMAQGKAAIILGARQTGKTTLIKNLLPNNQNASVFLNADEPYIRENLQGISSHKLKQIIGGAKIVVIDEAQRVKNIGLTMKLICDELPDKKLIATGSSSLDLANEINEPLTGRKLEMFLYPIAWQEFVQYAGFLQARQQLETRVIYGMYPDVIMNPGREVKLLKNLAGSYLFKDVLTYSGIRKPDLLDKLVRALALQVGSEVSLHELAKMMRVDKNTVDKYIDLLEKAFIVFRLQPFSRNHRNEISSSRKIYFWDTGIRNALINNFSDLNMRQDKGALWENFMIAERLKYLHNNEVLANSYYWRTYQQQEIDYVEEKNGGITAVELKWNTQKKVRFPKTFTRTYSNAETKFIHPDNLEEFIG